MSVEVDIVYTGDLLCEARHGPSGSIIVTEAPVDNGGKGMKFSPTDLVATALGTCILTIMAKVAERHGWTFVGTRVHIVKEMVADPHRRIGTLRTTVTLPPGGTWSVDDRARLERAAHTCPVKHSLHPNVQVPIEFIYPE